MKRLLYILMIAMLPMVAHANMVQLPVSDLGIWLSVDPLADKYPWISPYAYCNWNPVRYVNQDGRGIVFAKGTTPQRFC